MPMDGVQGVDKTRVIKWCEMQVCMWYEVCTNVWRVGYFYKTNPIATRN